MENVKEFLLEYLIIGLLFTLSYLIIEYDLERLKKIGLINALILFSFSLGLWIFFDSNVEGLQYEVQITVSELLSIQYHLGVDGISLFFVILTFFLLIICLLSGWTTITYKVKEFYILFYTITFLLINVFCVLDLLLFYIAFESVLIPMFLIIGIWGSRDRKIHAAYQFFLYTLLGSVIMLIAVIYIYITVGSLHLYTITTFPYSILEGRFLWLALFASFAVKVPMVPVHIWLPEAHVEAPTAGSVLLAGILLKMGTYGLIRFSMPMFIEATNFFQPLVYTISAFSIFYGVMTTIRQTDLKKIIAYSSVVHMNYVMLGIMSCNIYGLEGAIFLMLSHGIVSSALFLAVGFLYERYHTRVLIYFGGLVLGMPIFSLLFFILTLANVSLPGTSSFIGEFSILISIFPESIFLVAIAAIGVILSAVYAIWFYNRLIFGNQNKNYLVQMIDLNLRETFLISICVILSIFFGLFPNLILENIQLNLEELVNKIRI